MAAKAETVEVTRPTLTEVTVNYSFGMKVQVVKFEETADFHCSETRKFNVEGMSDEEVTAFIDELRPQMYERVAQDVIDRADRAVNEREY